MAEKAIRLGGESTAAAITQAVQELYPEHKFTEAEFARKDNAAEIAVDTNFAAQSFWKDVRIRFFRKKSAVLGLILIVFIVLLAGIVFGPGAGFAVGALADMIGSILAGYAINPLITLGAGAIGLVAGLAWQKLPQLRTGLRLQISVLLGHFVGSMVITSLALRIFYGYPWSVLAARVPNALILTAVNTVLLRLLMENKAVMAAVKK